MRLPHHYLLDASVVFSFDASGFRRHARAFDPADLEVDLSGRVCLVTGANSGIGRATARELALRNATVLLLCRNPERGQRAEDELRAETGSESIRFHQLDLSDLVDVRRYAAETAPERIDVLIHNAGLLPLERQLSPQGHEITLATHVLGPLLLSQLLRERLASGARRGRIVWVSSGGMYTQALSLRDVQWEERDYDGVVAYAQTKRMQVVLAELLAERWPELAVNSMHPGWADSPGVERSLPTFHKLLGKRLRTPAQGADTVVWLAVADAAEARSGEFFFDREARSPYLLGKQESPERRRELWDACQRWLAESAPASPPEPASAQSGAGA
ncbi:MAG TPA: dehydrogenase [Planctomycetes bacterium]|nr:dehydrogenase [Planctomycetota bacterium]